VAGFTEFYVHAHNQDTVRHAALRIRNHA
jgi:hypothetical protein